MGVAVPKRSIKKAVNRNRIKRLVREAYRLQKNELLISLEKKGLQVAFMLIYTKHEVTNWQEIEKAIAGFLNNLIVQVESA